MNPTITPIGGPGMDQTTARRRARTLGGVATHARRSLNTGKWITGGWMTPASVWIVVSLDHQAVLDDTAPTA